MTDEEKQLLITSARRAEMEIVTKMNLFTAEAISALRDMGFGSTIAYKICLHALFCTAIGTFRGCNMQQPDAFPASMMSDFTSEFMAAKIMLVNVEDGTLVPVTQH